MIAVLSAAARLVVRNKRIILFVLVLILLATTFSTGWKAARYSCIKDKLEALNNLIDEQELFRAESKRIEGVYYEAKEERRVKYRELYKEAGKQIKAGYDISSCDIGDDGLLLWNAANKGEAPGKLKTAMP